MGIYDNNLKRTNLGYQFDRNVYIGIQTNDNRVVTFKDLSGAVATQIASGGGGEDIQLQLSSIEGLSSATNPADHLSFHRDGLPVEYDILPQYVRAAEPEEGLDLSDGKACLLMPVVDDNDEIIGYKLYATDTLSMATLQLVIGSSTYTYDGSAAVEINFGTIPTVAASSTNIVTEIPDSDSSTDIPTAGAVHKFAASAGSLNMTAATSGYLVGVIQQPSATTQTLAPVGSESIKWGTAASYVGSASQWLNANITGHLNNDFVINIGGTTYSYNGSYATAVNLGTIPTVAASSVAIVTDISTTSGAASSTAIPTEGAVYKFAAAAGSVKATASASGYILGTANGVTATETSGAGALNPVGTNSLKWSTDVSTLPTVSHWINANITGRLNNNFVINIGGTTYSYNGGAAETINLSTIPTVSASSVGITTSVSSSSSSQIPTEGAVYDAIQRLAPGIGGIATSGTGNAVTELSYDSTTKTLTVTSGTTFLTGVTGSGAISVTGTGASRTISLNASFTSPSLTWGAATTYATVNGTTYSITLPTVNTIPTVAASSIGITTSISSASSNNIPTEGAVLTAIQSATPNIQAGNNISITTSGSTKTIGLHLITQPVSFGQTSGNHLAFDDWGAMHLYNQTWYVLSNDWGDEYEKVHMQVAWAGVTISSALFVPTITSSSSSTAAANKGYVDGINLAYDSTTHIVTFTKADNTTVTFTTASSWDDLSNKPTFNSITLSWGSAVTYATVSSVDKTITLPTVNTIPTVAAASMGITTSIASGATGGYIPTDKAVYDALALAPGIATVTSSGSGAMVTGIAYDSGNRTLSYTKDTASVSGQTVTIGSHSTTWTNTASLSWDSTTHAVKAGVDNTSAVIPLGSTTQIGLLSIGTAAGQAAAGDHAHTTLSVFGQSYTGATARTIAAGSGLTTTSSGSTTTVSLNASFLSPTLAWGTATKYATVGGTSYSISLPTVNTIPTVAASSMGVVTTVSASASDAEIPTAKAVWSVANAAGKVKEIQVNGVTQTISSAGVVNLPAIPATLDNLPDGSTRKLSNYLWNYGNDNSRPNGTTFTLPVGANPRQMRSGATSGADIGIFHLSDDNAFICNSSDNSYLFATFDTDDTADFSSADNASFAVLSSHAGVKMKGTLTVPTVSATAINENGTALTDKYAQKSAFSYNSTTGVLTISFD